MQLFDDKFADNFEFDVLDPTKLIPEEQIQIRKVGRLVDAAGIVPDDGVVELNGSKAGVASFLKLCHGVRFWPREPVVDRT